MQTDIAYYTCRSLSQSYFTCNSTGWLVPARLYRISLALSVLNRSINYKSEAFFKFMEIDLGVKGINLG